MKKSDSLLKSTSYFTAATLISRVLGLIRNTCVAAFIPKEWQDIFWTGFKIPSTFRQLFAEGALSAAFIPLLTRVREKEGEDKAQEISSAIFYALNLFVGGVTLLAIVFSPWFVPYILDFPVDSASPDANWKVDAAIRGTQYMFPFLLFVAQAAWAMGILNTYRYFFLPALAPAMSNISLIIGCWIATGYEGIPLLRILSASVVIGGLLQFIMQVSLARKIGFFPPRKVSPFHPVVRQFLRMLAPSVFGLAIYQINALVTQTYFASKFGEGGITQMNNAFLLIQFPLGVVGVALASASFPRVAQFIAQDRFVDASKILSDVIKYLMLLIIPAAVGFIVLGHEIVSVLLNYGNFRRANWVTPTYEVLVGYSLGLFFYTVVKVLVQAFQAHHDFRTPVITGAIAVTLNISLCAVFVGFGWPIWSLAIASSIASATHTTILTALLRRKMKEFSILPLLGFMARVSIACAGMAAVCLAARMVLPAAGDTKIMEMIHLAVGIFLGASAYFGAGWFLFTQELRAVLRLK